MAKRVDYLIEFRMGKGFIEELCALYQYFAFGYRPDSFHEELLYEHIKDLWLRLDYVNRTMLKTGKIGLNNSEALAFYTTWNIIDLDAWPLANVIILDMLQKIDKRIKAPKHGINK